VVVDSGKAYLIDRVGTMRCFSAADGKLLWQADLAGQLGVRPPQWKFSASPVIRGKVMYVDLGVIAALNPADGKIIWKTKDYGPGYSTPQPFKFRGRDLLATFPKFGLVVVDARTGNVLAEQKWETSYGVNAATPVVVGDKIFISSGYNTGCALVQFTGNGFKPLWQNKNMRNHMASCVAIGNYIYGIDENQLSCLNIDNGSTQWSQRSIGKGALVAADGKLIVQADRGDLVIVRADPKAYAELSRIDAVGGRNQWTMPVIADGKVYCRSATGKLACIQFK
jgi:outer membrane protein assembly factor BamB